MKKLILIIITFALVTAAGYNLYSNGYLDNTLIDTVVYELSGYIGKTVPSPVKVGKELSFYPAEQLSVECSPDSVTVRGISKNANRSNIVLRVEDMSGEVTAQETTHTNNSGAFEVSASIPSSASGTLDVAVFANSASHGTFLGWATDYVFIEYGAAGWHLKEPMMYMDNVAMYTKEKPLSAALRGSHHVQKDNAAVRMKAARITEGMDSDYEKAAALHDYICDNFYYDRDIAARETIGIESAADIISSNRGICSGYANAYAAMCRSLGIPCVVVTGYVLGFDSDEVLWNSETSQMTRANHAWNEVYADGRWVIVDTTWDCGNSYKNGHVEDQNGTSHLYFDANLEFFSANHKILRYRDI